MQDRHRQENDEERYPDQNNRVVQIKLLPIPQPRKVEPDAETKQGEKKRRELSHLFPVQEIPRVKFKDERVIDLVLQPNPTVQRKQREE